MLIFSSILFITNSTSTNYMARSVGFDLETLTGLQPIHPGPCAREHQGTLFNEDDVSLSDTSEFHHRAEMQPLHAHSVNLEPGLRRSPDFSNITTFCGSCPARGVSTVTATEPLASTLPNNPPSWVQQNRQIQYKLTPPKPYTMGDNFCTFHLILMNYMKDAYQLEQQQAILLSLIDPKLLTIAHPIVQRGSNITVSIILWILGIIQYSMPIFIGASTERSRCRSSDFY